MAWCGAAEDALHRPVVIKATELADSIVSFELIEPAGVALSAFSAGRTST